MMDIELLSSYGVKIAAPKIPKINESFDPIDEAVIGTKYPNIGKVIDVDIEELFDELELSVEGGPGVKPLLIWGAPGIGKTAIINAIAKKYFGANAKDEKRFIDFDLMTRSAEDFFLPFVANRDDEARAKRGEAPDTFLPVRRIDRPEDEELVNGPDGKGGILFFDEIARCNPRVQNVCLKLIDERKIGNYVLGKQWTIVCAANRKTDLSDDQKNAFHWDIAIANRFRQVNYAATLEGWTDFAANAKDEFGELLIDPKILAFLKFDIQHFHLIDPDTFSESDSGSEAWPSPRSWTDASVAIKERKRIHDRNGWKDRKGNKITADKWEKEQERILTTLVGSNAAGHFMGFKRLMDKINPEDIKKVWTKPKDAPKYSDKGLQMDEKHALISAAVFNVQGRKSLTNKEMDNFVEWLIVNKDPIMAMKTIRLLKDVVDFDLMDNEYFQIELQNALTDAYPHIFDDEYDKN